MTLRATEDTFALVPAGTSFRRVQVRTDQFVPEHWLGEDGGAVPGAVELTDQELAVIRNPPASAKWQIDTTGESWGAEPGGGAPVYTEPTLATAPASATVNSFQTLRLTGWFPDIVDFETFNYNAMVSDGVTTDTSNAVTVVESDADGIPTAVDAGIFVGSDKAVGPGTIQLCHSSDPLQPYANPLPLELVAAGE
jgi:hypothetical protein